MLHYGLFQGNIECTLSHFADDMEWAEELITWRVGRLYRAIWTSLINGTRPIVQTLIISAAKSCPWVSRTLCTSTG